MVRRSLGIRLAAFAALGVAVAAILSVSAPPSAAATPNLAPALGSLYGAYVAGGQAGISSFESAIGRKLAIDNHFWAWTDPWPTSTFEGWDVQNGRIPMVTWDGPETSLDQVNNGSQDTIIRNRANAAAAFGQPILVRWGYEMNGTWFAWSGTKNGNDPTKFVAAWKRIVNIFRTAGATNVLWIWNPNDGDNPNVSWNKFYNYYPGDSYVDWVGIDGYNWGTTQTYSSWQSFTEVFSVMSPETVYSAYAGRKPIIIAETGSVEQGGDKAAWYSTIPDELRMNFPAIKAIVFLNAVHNSYDERAETSPASLAAYKVMVASQWLHPETLVLTPPASGSAPTINGAPEIGQTLTASAGSWSCWSTHTYSYQWLRDGSAITGATGASYTVDVGDVAHAIAVKVTATNSAGSNSATSSSISVLATAPSNISLPVLSGNPAAGETLTASTGTWSGTQSTFSYQWQRQVDYAGLIKAASPAAYWRLGETSGTSAVDASGRGVGGKYSNVSLGASGAVASSPDRAVSFSSGQMTAASSTLNFVGTAPFSLEAWVKPTTLDTSYRRLFAKEDTTNGLRNGYVVWLRNNAVGFERWTSGVASGVRSSTALPVGSYSLVDAVFDGSTMRLYINGNLVASGASTNSLPIVTAPFSLGGSSYGGNWLLGTVDEAAVYGRALTTSEVAHHYTTAALTGSGWTDITGATGSSYMVANGDLGFDVRVTVTATNSVGTGSASSTATATVAG